MTQDPIAVWNEVRITSEGISISLISESTSGTAVIEDETWFTFDEMQAQSPSEPMSLNLSDETQEALSEMRKDACISRIRSAPDLSEKAEHLPENPSAEELLAYMGLDDMSEVEQVADQSENLPTVGQIVEDGNPPHWSQDNRMEVVGIPDKSADEYIVSDSIKTVTVADVNLSCDPDEPVVEVVYVSDLPDAQSLGGVKARDYDEDDIYAFPLSRLEQ